MSKKGVDYLKDLPAEEANDLIEQIDEAVAEGATTKKAEAAKLNVSVPTLRKFMNGNLNPDRP
jgi:hypothetical protein